MGEPTSIMVEVNEMRALGGLSPSVFAARHISTGLDEGEFLKLEAVQLPR